MCIDTWIPVVVVQMVSQSTQTNDATYVDFVKNLQEHIETRR